MADPGFVLLMFGMITLPILGLIFAVERIVELLKDLRDTLRQMRDEL